MVLKFKIKFSTSMIEMKKYEKWMKREKQEKYQLMTQGVLNPKINPCGSKMIFIPSFVSKITKWGSSFFSRKVQGNNETSTFDNEGSPSLYRKN